MRKNNKGFRNRSGIVYSTLEDFEYTSHDETHIEAISNDKQDLRVMLDRRQRAGKQVTLVTGFIGPDEDLRELAKTLKTACGVGGSSKNGEVIIQGNFVEKILSVLLKKGYRAKRSGG